MIDIKKFYEERERLAVAVYESECLLFGEITLFNGATINAYLNLTANLFCNIAYQSLKLNNIPVKNVCGVTYAGIPFATLLAQKLRAPMLIRNKETSLCASDERIIGNIGHKNEVLIVEEVMCSATSTLQTIKDVEDAGMIVKHVLVMVDLEQGGEMNLLKMGYQLHSVLKLSEMADILHKNGLLDNKRMEDVKFGWKETFAPNGDCITDTILEKRKAQSYESRVSLMKSKVAQRLFKIICSKKSNLCVTVDSNNFDNVIKIATQIGPHICMIGLHLDSFDSQNLKRMEELYAIARKHDFLILDDRKFSETGDELKLLLEKTLKLVDLITVLPLEGNCCISVLNEVLTENPDKGLIIVGSCFTQDSLIKPSFERNIVKLTLEQCPSITGFVTVQNSDIPLPFVHLMRDIKTTCKVTDFSSNQPYYAENIITQKMAADVVMISATCCEQTLNFVQQKQLTSWLGYENRFNR